MAKFEATEICRTGRADRLAVLVYGRDAADARLLTKAGRFVLYRDSGPSITLTRLQQVEHEAYLTLRAGQAGVAVPEVAEAGTAGPSKDALLVCLVPPGVALADADAAEISDAALDDLYRQWRFCGGPVSRTARSAGDALLVDPVAQTVALADFRNAAAAASPDQLDRDLAARWRSRRWRSAAEPAADAAARCLEPDLGLIATPRSSGRLQCVRPGRARFRRARWPRSQSRLPACQEACARAGTSVAGAWRSFVSAKRSRFCAGRGIVSVHADPATPPATTAAVTSTSQRRLFPRRILPPIDWQNGEW